MANFVKKIKIEQQYALVEVPWDLSEQEVLSKVKFCKLLEEELSV